MPLHKIGLILVITIVSVCFQGCLAVGLVGATYHTVAYSAGEDTYTAKHDIDTVYKATLQTIDQLDVFVLSNRRDSNTAEIIVRDVQKEKTTIKLKSKKTVNTEISIRVGTYGDKLKSGQLFDMIQDNLDSATLHPR